MHILWTLIVGFVVGLIARAVKPGDDSMGWIMTMLLGVAGAFLASFAGQALGFYRPGEPAGIIASVLGSVVLLALFAMFQRRRYA
ncbi:MAG: GlsB/YeaQ/YmgE family stress response membrane protein [Polyangiales bacterium]